MIAVALAAAVLLSVPACGGTKVNEGDDGSAVVLGVGDVLTVNLGANHTTGYSWQAANVPGCLVQEGEPEYDSKGPPLMMGAPGEETWHFTAAEVGEGELELEYRKPWEETEPAAETFTLKVTVE